MRAKTFRFVIAALFATAAYGQPAADEKLDRVLHFTHAATAQDLQEVTTVIRSITELPQASADTAQKALVLRGTAGQIALAGWLIKELDQPAQQLQNSSTYAYGLLDSGDDAVRVIYLKHAGTVQEFEEIVTAVRSTADIRRLFIYNAPRAVVVRGTAVQLALAEWLFNEMDQPAPQIQNSTHAYPGSVNSNEAVRVFHLANIGTVQNLQEVVTLVRSTSDIRRMFTYNTPRAVAARGPAAQMALAEWLFTELDKPTQQRDPAPQEFRLSGSADDVTRVFYLMHAGTVPEFQDIATQVRGLIQSRRLFICNAPRAIALRGTPSDLALADRLIKERDK